MSLKSWLLCFLLSLFLNPVARAQVCAGVDWPLWQGFKKHYLQDSGRVLDGSTDLQHSSSEGQSYGMFFALVANDRPAFESMWRWSVDNLAGGDMSQRLPAWIWGLSDKAKWEVLDANSASDADVWFAYTLLEAGRLWNEPKYEQAGQALLALIQEQEVVELPELGAMLLPGKDSFVKSETSWQLNLSYLPVPVLRRLSKATPAPAWKSLAENSVRFMQQAAPKGLAADWNYYQQQDGRYVFTVDQQKGPVGSYDAIRTYLWAGMTDHADPLAQPALQALSGMAKLMQSEYRVIPPEQVNTQTGAAQGEGPFGFSAALLPYFIALNMSDQAAWQRERVQVEWRAAMQPTRTIERQPPYYDVMLSLFGLGWAEGYYRFAPDGLLRPKWQSTCE